MSKSILITTGGTGGHVFPAEALAHKMLEKGWNVEIITDKRGKHYLNDLNPSIKLTTISIRKSSKKIFEKIIFIFFLIFSIIETSVIFFKKRPNIVIGFGGYPSFPILLWAKVLKIKIIIHEQNVILGKVNKIFSKKATMVTFGLKPKENHDNNFKNMFVGTPVRTKILKFHKLNNKKNDDKFKILVLGGSQGAKVLTETLLLTFKNFSNEHLKNFFVYFQCRYEDKIKVNSFLKELGIENVTKVFFEDIGEVIFQSDLVISRAGASTISELTIIGRPSILVPLSIATNNHQFENALVLENFGASKIINEKHLNSEKLYKEIENFYLNPILLKNMSKKVKQLSRPNATYDLYEIINKKVT